MGKIPQEIAFERVASNFMCKHNGKAQVIL